MRSRFALANLYGEVLALGHGSAGAAVQHVLFTKKIRFLASFSRLFGSLAPPIVCPIRPFADTLVDIPQVPCLTGPMLCPRCQTETNANICPQCSLDLNLYSELAALRRDLASLRTLVESLTGVKAAQSASTPPPLPAAHYQPRSPRRLRLRSEHQRSRNPVPLQRSR